MEKMSTIANKIKILLNKDEVLKAEALAKQEKNKFKSWREIQIYREALLKGNFVKKRLLEEGFFSSGSAFYDQCEHFFKQEGTWPVNMKDRRGEFHAKVEALYDALDRPGFSGEAELISNAESVDEFFLNKVFISSAGRSGSTAVKDFLLEFDEVYVFPNEWRVVSGPFGIHSIEEKLLSGTLGKLDLLNFFLWCVLGFSRSNDNYELKQIIKTNQLIDDVCFDEYVRYAIGFLSSVWGLSSIRRDSSCKSFCYRGLSRSFINNVIRSLNVKDKKNFLFSNVVSVNDCEQLCYLGDGYLIPVFRDPRSLHAAKKAEKDIYMKKVDRLVQTYSKQRERFSSFLQVAETSLTVRLVIFEEFVFFRSRRVSLAKLLSLNFHSWHEGSRFVSEESLGNVFLHRKVLSENESEIIARKLPQYCRALSLIETFDKR